MLVSDLRPTYKYLVPLRQLALQLEDLRDGTQLLEPQEINNKVLYVFANNLVETEGISTEYAHVLKEYCQILLDLDFTDKFSISSHDTNFQQEIDVFFTSEGAEKAMVHLPQLTKDTLIETYKELGIKESEIHTEIVDIDNSGLGLDSLGIFLSMESGGKKGSIISIWARENNIISIVTITSSSTLSLPYSADNSDDALLLSQKAIHKIKSMLENRDLLLPIENTGNFVNLLNLVPADAIDENNKYVKLNDYAAIRILNNVGIPEIVTDKEVENYTKAMLGYGDDDDYPMMYRGSFISGHDWYSEPTSIQVENVGFNLFNVDADIFTENHTFFYSAAIGRFDPFTTSETMNKQEKWPEEVRDDYTKENYRDISIYNWINGDIERADMVFKPPIFDPFGRLLPLAVTPTNVFYSDSINRVKSMIDSSLDLSRSLADLPEYRSAAEGLASLGAYSGIIGIGTMPNGMEFQRDISDAPLLKPYLSFGTGAGRDFLGPYMTLVLVHNNAETARKNADILVERVNTVKWIASVDWENSWRLYVDCVQVRSEDNIVMAKLYSERAWSYWDGWLFESDPLLLHE